MFKPSITCLAIASAICLSACGKESEFKSAINKSIETDYNCLNINSSGFGLWGVYDKDKELEQYKKDNSFVIIDVEKDGKIDKSGYGADNSSKADALVKAGLLTKTTKTEQAIRSFDKTPIKGTVFVINLYNLTDTGKQTVKEKHYNSLFGSGDQKYTFCYTHPQVDSILNFTEQDLGGQKIVQVKYSYKFVDVADWVNKEEIKAAFPEIDKLLNNPDKIATTGLIKTNNGWQTNL